VEKKAINLKVLQKGSASKQLIVSAAVLLIKEDVKDCEDDCSDA